MCYPCLMTCENCKQKYLFCPDCGTKNMVVRETCMNCGLVFSDELRAKEYEAWRERTGKTDNSILVDSQRERSE